MTKLNFGNYPLSNVIFLFVKYISTRTKNLNLNIILTIFNIDYISYRLNNINFPQKSLNYPYVQYACSTQVSHDHLKGGAWRLMYFSVGLNLRAGETTSSDVETLSSLGILQ